MVFGALRSSEQSHQGFRKRVGTPFLNENDGNIRKQWSSVVIEESWNPDVLASYGTLAGGIGIKPCKIKPWFQHVWFFKYVTCVCVCACACPHHLFPLKFWEICFSQSLCVEVATVHTTWSQRPEKAGRVDLNGLMIFP